MTDEERISKIEVNVAKVKVDVENMKGEYEKHISPTLTKIWDKVNEMCPMVKENTFWVGKIKWGICFLAIVGVLGGLITTGYFLLRKFAGG